MVILCNLQVLKVATNLRSIATSNKSYGPNNLTKINQENGAKIITMVNSKKRFDLKVKQRPFSLKSMFFVNKKLKHYKIYTTYKQAFFKNNKQKNYITHFILICDVYTYFIVF